MCPSIMLWCPLFVEMSQPGAPADEEETRMNITHGSGGHEDWQVEDFHPEPDTQQTHTQLLDTNLPDDF